MTQDTALLSLACSMAGAGLLFVWRAAVELTSIKADAATIKRQVDRLEALHHTVGRVPVLEARIERHADEISELKERIDRQSEARGGE